MAEFKSTISSQDFDKALHGGLDYAADKSEIQEALKELSAKGFVYIGPDQPTDGTMYWLDTSVEEPDVPVVPDEPDVPDDPEVTLTSISATYSGGDVAVGTALTDLTGIVVTATYSDGSTAPVTGYTLSGTIAEGSNTITVTYEGMTATFTVTGVAEEEPSGGVDLSEANVFAIKTSEKAGENSINLESDSTPTYDAFMALDCEKLYLYFDAQGEYKKATSVRCLYTPSWSYALLGGSGFTVSQVLAGECEFITNVWDKFDSDGYVVYEYDVAKTHAAIQALYDAGTLDATKGRSLQFKHQIAAGGKIALLYNYNG